MAKETQKAKIERLENELKQANQIIQKLNNEISEIIDKADNSFENSSTYKQMKKQIKDLELKLKVSEDSKEHNRRMYESELKKNDEMIKEFQELNNENERLKKKRERKANENNLELIGQQLQDARDTADKWHKQLFIQQQKNKELEKEIEYLVEKNSIIQKHNERGAGRKSRFTQSEIETIKMYRLQGKTIKEIAEMFKCSVGLIHKIINEKWYFIFNVVLHIIL